MRAIRDLERGRSTRPYLRSIRMLADALGLSDMQRTGLSELAHGPGSAAAGGQAVPSQLPAGVARFVGRERELGMLDELLGRAQCSAGGTVVISAIGGTAGIGKTALAVHWAHRRADWFPDGQLYVDLRGFGPSGAPVEPAEAVGGFLAVLGVTPERWPTDVDARVGMYRSLVAGRRMVIVLDNARDVAQVRPLLPGSPGCLVLVTSRAELDGLAVSEAAHLLTLDVLTDDEAWQLLADRLGAEQVAAEPEVVRELIGLCARLPLALAIVSARASMRPKFPLATLAAELRDTAGRLDALDTSDPTASIRSVFSWSYQQLRPEAARLFRLLGLHPGPDISIPAAASLAGCQPSQGRRLLAALARAHLLTEHVPGRYACHDLLRAYAADQADATDSEPDREAATGRLIDHYLQTAYTAALLLNPARKPIILDQPRPGVRPEPLASLDDARTWFEAEHQVLVAAVGLAAEAGLDGAAWQLPWAMTTFLHGLGRWQDQLTLGHTALRAATRLGDVAGQSVTRHALATACAMLGEYDQARTHLIDDLSLCRLLGDRAGEARAHLIFGFVEQHRERYTHALNHAEQALALFQAIGDRAGETAALNGAGWCLSLLGEHKRAHVICQQALAIYVDIGNRYGEAHTWDSLGYAEHHLGRLADAIASYTRAIDLHAQLGNRANEATSLDHLGDTHQAVGDLQRAREAWQRALAIFDDLHHPDADKLRGKLG